MIKLPMSYGMYDNPSIKPQTNPIGDPIQQIGIGKMNIRNRPSNIKKNPRGSPINEIQARNPRNTRRKPIAKDAIESRGAIAAQARASVTGFTCILGSVIVFSSIALTLMGKLATSPSSRAADIIANMPLILLMNIVMLFGYLKFFVN